MAKKGGTDSGSEVAQARADELARQERIRTGTQQVDSLFDSQFNPAFYTGRAQSYSNYAMPQVEDQYKDAAKQLTFALTRRGALDSSSRADLETQLQRKRALEEQNINSQADTYANSAKANVEAARADLINTLNATGDAQGAVNSATSRAQILSAVPGYSPIASLFADFTDSIGKQAAAERAYSYGAGPKPAISTGLFSVPSRAVVSSS